MSPPARAGRRCRARSSPSHGHASARTPHAARDLVRLGRHGQRARPDEVAVDRVLLDRALDAVEVLAAHRRHEVHLPWPAGESVAEAVRQARLAEATVAPAGGVPARRGLQQQDVAFGVPLLGEQGGPEPEVPTAHDDQVGGVRSRKSREDCRTIGALQPVDGVRRLGQRRLGSGRHLRQDDVGDLRGCRPGPGREPAGTSPCRRRSPVAVCRAVLHPRRTSGT